MIWICKVIFLLIPWIVILLIGIPSSPSPAIIMSLTSTIIIPSSTPVRITLTVGISIPIVSVTVIRVISIPLSSSATISVVLSMPFIVMKVSLSLTMAGFPILRIIPVIRVFSISTATRTSIMSTSSSVLSPIIFCFPCIRVIL